MSEPNPKIELHELVDDFMETTGEPQDAHYLHEEIDHPEKRSWLYEQYLEFLSSKI